MSGCWLWLGSHRNGYASVRQSDYVHRIQLGNPAGVVVRHKCDLRGCINPDHLETGTHQDNMDDMWRRGRARPRGKPPLTDEQKDAIRKDLRRQVDIANDYGVHQTAISLVKTGKL